MNKVFSDQAWEDYLYWQNIDRKILRKINELLRDIDRNGYAGLGKPEPLKHDHQGHWSRRINEEHRLVYFIQDDQIYIVTCKNHY